MKKLVFLLIIFILMVIYHEKILDQVEEYTDKHREAGWAPKVEYYIGNFYYYTTKYDKAIEIYEWILYTYKKSDYADDAQYMQARCYEDQRDFAKAMAAYRKFLGTYPKSEWVNKAQTNLENLELRN